MHFCPSLELPDRGFKAAAVSVAARQPNGADLEQCRVVDSGVARGVDGLGGIVPASGGSYSSPHLLTIDGVEQVLLLSTVGATSVVHHSRRHTVNVTQ